MIKRKIAESARLVIRPYDPALQKDVRGAYQMYANPSVIKYIGQNQPEVSEQTQYEKLVKVNEKYLDDPYGHGFWAIETKDSHRVIGTMILKFLPDSFGDLSDDCEIGWHLNASYWGQGYAAEAAKAMLEYCFTRTQHEFVNAVIYPGNDRSKRVALRLGMEYQGTTKQYYDGILLDHFRLSKVAWTADNNNSLFLGTRKSTTYSSTLLRKMRLTKVAEG